MADSQVSPDFYLALTDGTGQDIPRACWRLSPLKADTGKELLLVHLAPPLIHRNLPVDDVVLAALHVGRSVLTITEWPMHVHVAIRRCGPTDDCGARHDVVSVNELEVILWGALYSTEAAAANALRQIRP